MLHRLGYLLQGTFSYVLGRFITILWEDTTILQSEIAHRKAPPQKNIKLHPPQVPLEAFRGVAASIK